MWNTLVFIRFIEMMWFQIFLIKLKCNSIQFNSSSVLWWYWYTYKPTLPHRPDCVNGNGRLYFKLALAHTHTHTYIPEPSKIIYLWLFWESLNEETFTIYNSWLRLSLIDSTQYVCMWNMHENEFTNVYTPSPSTPPPPSPPLALYIWYYNNFNKFNETETFYGQITKSYGKWHGVCVCLVYFPCVALNSSNRMERRRVMCVCVSENWTFVHPSTGICWDFTPPPLKCFFFYHFEFQLALLIDFGISVG